MRWAHCSTRFGPTTRRRRKKSSRSTSTSTFANAIRACMPQPRNACSRASARPELVDTRNDQRLGRLFGNRVIRRYPAFTRVLRHGGRDRADRRVLQARRAGTRGKEADPLPAGSRRRRQVLDRGAPEVRDGTQPDLRAQGLAGQRVAARTVPARALRADAAGGIRHSPPLSHRNHVAVGDQAPAPSSTATSASSASCA